MPQLILPEFTLNNVCQSDDFQSGRRKQVRGGEHRDELLKGVETLSTDHTDHYLFLAAELRIAALYVQMLFVVVGSQVRKLLSNCLLICLLLYLAAFAN